MIRFAIIFIVAFLVVSGASIAWPYFSSAPRPTPLAKVHDIVMQTELGRNASNVLGTTDATSIEPLNAQKIGLSLSSSVMSAAQQKTQEIVVTHATRELTKQFSSLSEDQKNEIRSQICQP